MVKGQYFQTWIEQEFPKLLQKVMDDTSSEEIDADKNLEALWERTVANKVGRANLDTSLQTTNADMGTIKEQLNTLKADIPKQLQQHEEAYDKRASVLTSLWENHFDNRTNQVVPQFDKKIVDTCQKINNLETYVQNQISGFIESQEKQTEQG